jgi:hypothetical protein
MEEKKNTQSTPLSLILEDARAKTFAAINAIQQETGVPAFLFEGIVLDVLSQVRAQKTSEILQDAEQLNADLKTACDILRKSHTTEN